MEIITERGRLDTYDNFVWSLNYVTAQIVNLTGRKASFTKTVTIPYTKKNKAIFQGLDEWNVDNVGYDTKRSLKCFITHNGRELIRGTLVILKYTRLKEEQQVEIQIIAQVKNLITKLKKVKLNELDFSRWNHPYTAGVILGNVEYNTKYLDGTPQQFPDGKGYVYPLIDYGKDDTISEILWDVQELRPCLFLKEYIDTIFRYAELTYTSDFLNSPYFNGIAIENTISEIQLTDAQKLPFATEVENTAVFKTYGDFGGYPIGIGFDQPQQVFSDTWKFLDFTNIVLDTLNQWNIALPTDTYTAQRDGTYRFQVRGEYYDEFQLDGNSLPGQLFLQPYYLSGTPITYTINPNNAIGSHYIQIVKNGVAYDEIPLQSMSPNSVSQTFNWTGAYPLNYVRPEGLKYLNIEFVLDLVDGDTIQFRAFEEARNTFTGDLQSLIHRFYFEDLRVVSELQESIVQSGDEINFGNYIPDVDADAFIDAVFNLFNLWVLDDPNDENNLIIEPRTNFFNSGNHIDMSQKLDYAKLMTSDYLADKLPKLYKYMFSKSDDVLNKIDNDADSPYADYDSPVNVDFSIKTQKIETVFAPLITQEKNGLQYPLEYVDNDGVKEKLSAFLKIGFVSRQSGDWELRDQFAVINYATQYLRISEFSDLINPNYSLTFGDADAKIQLNTFPYWNLYRLFHQLTEEEQTRDGSKIIEAYFNLNENDIAQLDLRRAWFVNGVYYRIISVDNFNPLTNASTKVKLLQIEQPRFDFTSNEMIYKMASYSTKVLTTNSTKLINTQQGNVQLD